MGVEFKGPLQIRDIVIISSLLLILIIYLASENRSILIYLMYNL